MEEIKNLEAVVTHLKKELAEIKGSGFKNATSYSYSPGYTFPGNLPTELYYAPTPGTPALSDIFTIRQGIRTDEYLVLVNYLDANGKKYANEKQIDPMIEAMAQSMGQAFTTSRFK